MELKEQKGKLQEKSDLSKKRMRKINELTLQNKRQGTLLEIKNKEVAQLKSDIQAL